MDSAASLLFFVLLIGVMYLVLIRPQQKRQKEVREMQASLSKGDDVITIGGLHGQVYAISDDFVDLQVNDDTILRFQRNAIAKRVPQTVPTTEAAEA